MIAIRSGVFALVFAFVAAFALPADAQEPANIAGTTVTLTPPEGFVPADGFSGLVNEQTEASVLVAELPGEAHQELAPLFRDQMLATTAFAGQGVAVENVAVMRTDDGEEFPYLSGTQSAGGITFDKWIALYSGEKTVLLTVQAPQASGLDPAAVKALLRSVSLGAEATLEEKLAALPFEVSAVEPFRVVDTIAGSGVLMTAGPLDVDPEGTQPLLIVALQISQPLSTDALEEVASALLAQTQGLKTAEVEQSERVEFAGEEGILLSGTATVADRTTRFEQYLAIGEEGRFVRLIATAGEDKFADIEQTIEAVAASVVFKD